MMDCFCEESWRNHTPHSTAQDRVLPAVSDRVKWPAHMGARPPPYFNAGMFVFKPDLATYHDLLSTLKAIPPTPFAEQSKASGLENAGGTGTGPPARPVSAWRHCPWQCQRECRLPGAPPGSVGSMGAGRVACWAHSSAPLLFI
ncbi:hypothetical protein CDL15_Pgr018292 [Punica granatum]|uniref:Hexosyltransferase n=1 Tax=Punica granatum TaxID=22663 RepID=A0A218WHV1_PUNGR|nr:hypothetical protein CDL15_Pgr018292 [Punica granatum]